MPFYTFVNEEEEIEELFGINDRPDTIEIKGKIYTYKPEFSRNFILKGMGWASKGTALAAKPKHGKEVGIRVDHNMKREMENG